MTSSCQWRCRQCSATLAILVLVASTCCWIAILCIVRSLDVTTLDHHHYQQRHHVEGRQQQQHQHQHVTASAAALLSLKRYGTIWGINNTTTSLASFENHTIYYDQQNHDDATSMVVVPVAQTVVDMNILSSNNNIVSSFCIPWHIVSDEWWTHHVEWTVFWEDDTHYCFKRIQNLEKRTFLSSLYRLQFPTTTQLQQQQQQPGSRKNNSDDKCSNVLLKDMWSSGFGADLNNVVDGLMRGMETHRPFQITSRQPWHYALPKRLFSRRSAMTTTAAAAACPTQDMFCYFLPISSCSQQVSNSDSHENETVTRAAGVVQNEIFYPHRVFVGREDTDDDETNRSRWYLEYATRLQTWLRKSVYDYTQHQIRTLPLQTPCTVMHVRRGDVVLHGTSARRYHAIRDYMNVTKIKTTTTPTSPQYQLERNILLLTDDDNAIHEALTEFSNVYWMYLNRTRYKAASGGWEQHLPSGNATLEMIILLSTLRLVRHCNSLVKSHSNFGNLILDGMRSANASVWFVNVEDGYYNNGGINNNNDNHNVIFNAKNAQTVGISKPYIRARARSPPPPH